MANFEEISKKVTDKVTDTYKTASKATGKLIEEGKLKFIISDNEAKMNDIYEVIGKEYCDSLINKTELDSKKHVDDINVLIALSEENEQSRERILQLKNIRKCINCKKEISMEHSFCQYCGTKQPEIVEEVEEEPTVVEAEIVHEKICKNCQAKLNHDEAFCPFCGETVE